MDIAELKTCSLQLKGEELRQKEEQKRKLEEARVSTSLVPSLAWD